MMRRAGLARGLPPLRSWVFLALLWAAAVGLAGCADGGDGAADDPSPTAGASTTTPSESPAPTSPFPGNLPLGEGACVVAMWEGGPLDGEDGAPFTHNGTLAFRIGSGHSGLGADVERALVGHTAGEAVEVESADDPARRPGSATLGRSFGPFDAEQPWDIVQFRLANPHLNLSALRAGDPVDHHPWEPYYNATYASHNETHAVLRYHPVHNRLFRLGDYPIQLRALVADDGSWREEYVTHAGAAFQIPPAPSYSCRTDFNLPPGDYTVAEVRATDLLLHFEPALPAELQGPARFRFQIVDYAP